MRGRSERTPTKFGSTRNTPRASGADASASATRSGGSASGSPVARVDVGPHPHGLEPGEDEPGEHGLVRAPRDDRPVAGPPERKRERLVPLRGAVAAESAQVGVPQRGREALGLPEHVGAHVQVVGARGERQVEAEEVVGEVRRALVARRREGRDARVGQVGGGRVGEGSPALVHGGAVLSDPPVVRAGGRRGLAAGFRHGSRSGGAAAAEATAGLEGRAARAEDERDRHDDRRAGEDHLHRDLFAEDAPSRG